MCGIVGYVSNHRIQEEKLKKSIDTLYMRGPDCQKLWIDDNVGLAHSRLSIQDLSHNANQPMVSSCKRYVIVYNGEIYNFKDLKNSIGIDSHAWSTHCDTEVILESYKKWGKECVLKFNGMFAFSIWDKKEEELFCARDRMGKKPFYYSFVDNEFLFASRPSALFELKNISKEINLQALRLHMDIGYIPNELSIYKHVKMLPPAHTLTFSKNKLSIERYWDFRQIETDYSLLDKDEELLIDELDELLTSAVKLRMISDVPFGAFLSGGIDSSLIVAMMTKISNRDVHTFSIGFDEKRWDESEHAETVAKYLKTNHKMEKMGIDSLLKLMPTFMKNFDEPFFDSSAFPTMAVSRLAKKDVTVALTGDGADELFGGYHYYNIVDKLKYFYKLPNFLRSFISRILYIVPSHKIKLLSQAINKADIPAAFAYSRSIIKDYDNVLVDDVLNNTKSIEAYFSEASEHMPQGLDEVEKSMRLDAYFTMPDEYLQKVDIGSMAYSLETRSPFLDYRVVEWAAKLPHSLKVKNGVNKYLPRKLAYRYVPREILDRPKQGFSVPVSKWLKDELKSDFHDKLYNQKDSLSKTLNISNIEKLFELHTSDKRDVHPLLWAVYSFLNWNSVK